MIKYHEMTLITSWLWFKYVYKNVKTNNTKALIIQFHKKKIAKLWIVKMMMIENKIWCKKIEYWKSCKKSFLNLEKNFFSIFNKIDDISDMKVLKYLLKESLKLHIFLLNIRNEIFFYEEKLIIWILNSDEQLFVMTALALCNINVCVLHAELKFNKCQKMIHEFVIKSKNVMILICSFYINFFRFNLQNLCHNVHFWNISMLKILLMQVIECVRHFDQKYIVKIYNYIILNNFNIKQLENNLIKMIFNLVVKLNDELFNIIFNIDTKKINFDY